MILIGVEAGSSTVRVTAFDERGGIVAARAEELCRLTSFAPAHRDAVWNDADAAALAG